MLKRIHIWLVRYRLELLIKNRDLTAHIYSLEQMVGTNLEIENAYLEYQKIDNQVMIQKNKLNKLLNQ